MAVVVGVAGLAIASRFLAGAAFAEVAGAGGVVSAIGPDEAVCSFGTAGAEATGLFGGSAQLQSANKATTPHV